MNKKYTFLLLVILVIGIIFISCGEDTADDAQEEPSESIPVIYEDDEVINAYLVRFNNANPDNTLSSEDFEKYYHHGKEHNDQIILNYEDNTEVVISDRALNEADVIITGNEASNEAFKERYLMFARAFDENISNEKLEDYWEEALNNDYITVEFDEFSLQTRTFDDAIEFVEITSKLEIEQ